MSAANEQDQKTIEVSTALEFQEAVGNFTTIVLTKDITIPYQYGIVVQNPRGVRIEGNGFTLVGDKKSIPAGMLGNSAISVFGGDIYMNRLTITNFGCGTGAIYLKDGVKALITNSLITKNDYSECAGIMITDPNGDIPGYSISNVTLNNVTLDNNFGYTGGGIAAIGPYRGEPRTTLIMIDCKVTNNRASFQGGGLYQDGANAFLKGVFFKNNVEKRKDDNDIFMDMNADCSHCMSSRIDISPCPEGDFESVDEGKITVKLDPYVSEFAPTNPRSYSCIPK
jgi:hypothetical protein